MKNTIWTIIAVAALGALGTTPAHASGGGGFLCNIPIIGQFLCPPSPGGGGGGGSVPEPASLAILAAGAGLVGAAVRRRRTPK
jgi:hypothetical protein